MAIVHSTTTAVVDAGASSTTISSFVVSGTNPVLVVKVSTNGSEITVTGVTWNTSEDFAQEITDINNDARASLWVLPNPTATTADIVISLSGSSRHVSAVSLYTGVDDTNPVRTSNSNNGSDTLPTVSLTAVSSDMIVDCLSQVSNGPDTAIGDHTERHDTAAIGGGADTRGASQELLATGGSDTMGWTMSSMDSWAVSALALREPFTPADSIFLTTLQDTGRGVGQARAARLGGELQ